MNQEDATNLLIEWMLNPLPNIGSTFSYDFYLPSMIRAYLESKGIQHHVGICQGQTTFFNFPCGMLTNHQVRRFARPKVAIKWQSTRMYFVWR